MFTVVIYVMCQNYENKSFYEGGVRWSPKGGKGFRVEVDSDEWFYGSDSVLEQIKEVISDMSDDYWRYEYIGHDVMFEDYEDITVSFNKKVGVN